MNDDGTFTLLIITMCKVVPVPTGTNIAAEKLLSLLQSLVPVCSQLYSNPSLMVWSLLLVNEACCR